MAISAVGYLRIASTDPAAWADFGTGVLGLMDAGREDAAGARFLRMDDHPFRFMIEPAEHGVPLRSGVAVDPGRTHRGRACGGNGQ